MRYFLFSFVLLGSAALAQTSATLVGSVSDSSGALVPNTKITAVQKATGLSRSTVTNQSGNYVLPLLPVGEYDISAESTGFKKKTVSGAILEVNQEPRVDFVLEVGAVTETVNVSGQATLLQTENAVVGHVVDNRYTTQIPLNGRDFAQLVLLVPGTATRPGGFEQTVGSATGSLGSVRARLIARGMIYSPSYGDLTFTVPLFDEFMRRVMPEFRAGR